MRILILLVLSSFAPAIAFDQTRLKSIVTDSSGAAIASAIVLIHWDPAGSTVGLASNVGIKEDRVVRTKEDGTFELDLPPGFYDIFATATAFSPTCRKVRMKGSETQEIKLRLNLDPLYTAEMGNRVETTPPKR
jgi:uncharacterized membrane protein